MPSPNAGYQEELFGEFSQGTAQRKRSFPKQALFSSKTVSFEQILFTVIGGLIAVVIAFSLGVEKGKSITQSYENHMAPLAAPPLVEPRVAAPILPPAEKVVHKEETKEVVLQASEPKSKFKGYTIQVASYKDRKSVEKLVVEFHLKGQKSFSLPKGEFMIVCVGNYPNPTDASKTAKTLKKQFPDCFVRKL